MPEGPPGVFYCSGSEKGKSIDSVMRALRNPCDIFSYFETCFSCRDLPGFGFCPGEMPEEAVAEVLEDVLEEEPDEVSGSVFIKAGRSMVNMVPSSLLWAEIVPWCAVTISFAIASPSPAPPVAEERAESRR